MAIPNINTYAVDENNFILTWEASPKSTIAKWNLYGSPDVEVDFIPPNSGVVLPGNFALLREGIPNVSGNPLTPGSVMVTIPRSELSIDNFDPYYFIITSIEKVTGVESALEIDNIHACPIYDDYFVDEAGWPVNVVYKNWEVDLWPLSNWDVNRYLNVSSLLGRSARQIKIDSLGSDIWVRFNSIGSDPISIRESTPYQFDLKRGELQINKIYLHNPTNNDATVRIFVAA